METGDAALTGHRTAVMHFLIMTLNNLVLFLKRSPLNYHWGFPGSVRSIIGLLGICLISTCKKNTTDTPPDYSGIVVGKWSAYTFSTNLVNVSVNVAQYPCIANNVMTYNADHTEVLNYVGQDTCYVSQSSGQIGPESFGEAGQAPINSTWSAHNNILYLDYNGGTEIGIISMVNNKYHIDFRDTINVGGGVIIQDTGYEKE